MFWWLENLIDGCMGTTAMYSRWSVISAFRIRSDAFVDSSKLGDLKILGFSTPSFSSSYTPPHIKVRLLIITILYPLRDFKLCKLSLFSLTTLILYFDYTHSWSWYLISLHCSNSKSEKVRSSIAGQLLKYIGRMF